MNSRISQKLIFSFFLFFTSIPPINSSEFQKINQNEKNQIFKLSRSEISKNKYQVQKAKQSFHKKFSNNNLISIQSDLGKKKAELIIQSDKQSEINNIIYAEGNVSASYRGKVLSADKIIFDKSLKKISAEGNITLAFGDQIFKISQLEYNFKNEKGYLLDVKGSINTDKLITDISRNFSQPDIHKLNYLLNFQRKEVLNTPNKVNNWIFSTEKITIDGEKWKTNKAIFSNDILQFKQVKLEINALEAYFLKEELRFRSSLNYLVLDENVSIPFWLGNRGINKSEQKIDSRSSRTIGYDKRDKDGLFIGRKLNSLNLDDFIIDIEPQFLIQRSLTGETKSFVQKGETLSGEKVIRDAKLADYFGLKSQVRGKVNNWDLRILHKINSLDIDKLSESSRFKLILNKEINFLDAKWDKSFYGVYRDRIWNGSMGESEIVAGYGSNLEKKHAWEVNDIYTTEVFSLDLANLRGEALNSKNLVDSFKINLFYSLDKKIPLIIDKPKNKIIDSSYKYIYEPITKGVSLKTRLSALYSLYDDGKHQEYIGLGLGPELILGDFKNKTFDYTKISIFPFYKFKNGESIFKFDQISDKFTLNIAFDQQLFGPIILQSYGILNLDDNSEAYGEFIDSKISLNWKKRSYEFGVFYQPNNQAGGISFSLFGFK